MGNKSKTNGIKVSKWSDRRKLPRDVHAPSWTGLKPRKVSGVLVHDSSRLGTLRK